MEHYRAGIALHHGEDQVELVQLQGHSNRPIAVTVEDGWRVEDHPLFPLSEVEQNEEKIRRPLGPRRVGTNRPPSLSPSE